LIEAMAQTVETDAARAVASGDTNQAKGLLAASRSMLDAARAYRANDMTGMVRAWDRAIDEARAAEGAG
jgi:hypothetical protein